MTALEYAVTAFPPGTFAAMDVLVVVDGGLVETLQASPLLRSLSAGGDDVRITLACPPAAASIAAHLPGVAETLPLQALSAEGYGVADLVRAWAALRRRRLNAAVLCATRPTATALAFFTGVPRRAGLAAGLTRLLLTDPVERRPAENRAAAWMRLAPALGLPYELHDGGLDPGAAARQAAEQRMVGGGFEDGRLMVAVAPGNGFADPLPGVPPRALSWEPERYAHLCNQLTHRHGAGVVVVGAEADRAVVDAMLLDIESPVLDLGGELGGLEEVAAVLERCDLLICGDSPLLHLAAAVGTPSVGLFGPTDGRVRAPYGPDHRVVQALPEASTGAAARRSLPGRAEPASLRQIRVDDVLAGIESPPR
jgi:ADP-heptose:LPS heptosyltransferase